MIELTLPEFAFVEGYRGNDDELYARNVILHTCTATVMEVFEKGDALFNEDVIVYPFKNLNPLSKITGDEVVEEMVIAMHYSATLDAEDDRLYIIEKVMKPAAKWYCDYCDYMDNEIIDNEFI